MSFLCLTDLFLFISRSVSVATGSAAAGGTMEGGAAVDVVKWFLKNKQFKHCVVGDGEEDSILLPKLPVFCSRWLDHSIQASLHRADAVAAS
jgi:hypothetical protein